MILVDKNPRLLRQDEIRRGTPVKNAELKLASVKPPLHDIELSVDAPAATIPVSIPHLPGMDELRIERARLDIRGRAVNQPPIETSATSKATAHGLGLAASDKRRGALVKLELLGLDVEPPAGTSQARSLRANDGGSTARLTWGHDASGEPYFEANGAAGEALHVLVRASSGSARPPLAAFPDVPMPGKSASLYGPALGGGVIGLETSGGKGRVVLTFARGLDVRGVEILIGQVTEDGGLPNELELVEWSATTLRGTWSTPPSDLAVTAADGEAATPVADFPGPLTAEADIDFSPVARALLGSRYLEAPPTTAAVTLNLRLSSSSAGIVEVMGLSVAGEYRRTPLPDGANLDLLGAPDSARLLVPPGLRPKAFTVTLDGRFGPARLVDACQPPPDEARSGIHLSPGRKLARYIPLSGVERGLPLHRVGIYARSDVHTEMLVSLCSGDPTRIGPRRGAPVSLSLDPSPHGRWTRAVLPPEVGVPPHAGGYYVLLEVTRGSVWWYTSPAAGLTILHSLDDGATWSRQDVVPRMELHVVELDERTGEPAPLPIALAWQMGPLTNDLLDLGAHGSGPLPSSFREPGVTLLGRGVGNDDPLGRVREAGEHVDLVFSCRRDLHLRISEAVISYDPWKA